MKKFAWLVILGVVTPAFAGNSLDDYAGQKKGSLEGSFLAATIDKYDFNDTLHSQYLKSKALNLGYVIANASLFTLTGYVRNYKKNDFIHIATPPMDRRIIQQQAKKLLKVGRAFEKTKDDDYKIAGQILVDMAKAILKDDEKEAKHLIAKYEGFYASDMQIAKDVAGKDQQMLNDIAQSITNEFNDVFNTFSSSIKEEALKALNLTTILGGI